MCYMTKSIRGIDDEVFQEFKAKAASEGKNVGEALNEAMIDWLDSSGEADLDDLDAWNWGEDSESLSEDYEEELYEKSA